MAKTNTITLQAKADMEKTLSAFVVMLPCTHVLRKADHTCQIPQSRAIMATEKEG